MQIMFYDEPFRYDQNLLRKTVEATNKSGGIVMAGIWESIK
jgi:hypothetical protein